jgi:transcriptional regulator with XRE-family HTH domain
MDQGELVKTFINTDLEFRKFAENIQIARKRRGLSLAELSVKSSISKTVLSRIESGDTSVGIGKVFNVLEALGLLKGLADLVNPELDREQAVKEINFIRETKIKKSKMTGIHQPSQSHLVRFMDKE